MSLHDPNWKYTSAAETAKPGYLARRFREVREEQKKQQPEHRTAGTDAPASVAEITNMRPARVTTTGPHAPGEKVFRRLFVNPVLIHWPKK